jgi:hypothetical protein
LAQRVAHVLGLHKDPFHFPQIGPIEAEVRRRVWWAIVHIDVTVTTATGLPPILDASWDVQQLSELKDELIGTEKGIEYESAVAAGNRERDMVDDPSLGNSNSMVSTGGILARGKLHSTCKLGIFGIMKALLTVSVAMRKALLIIAGRRAPNPTEIKELRYLFRRNHAELVSRIQRIPEDDLDTSSETEGNYAVRLNKWARCLLSTFIDRNWSRSMLEYVIAETNKFLAIVCHPLLITCALTTWSSIHDQLVNFSVATSVKAYKSAIGLSSTARVFRKRLPTFHAI